MNTPASPHPEDGSEHDERAEEEGGAIGIFPSWGWVYGSVVVYTIIAIVLLHILTVTLDHGIQ